MQLTDSYSLARAADYRHCIVCNLEFPWMWSVVPYKNHAIYTSYHTYKYGI